MMGGYIDREALVERLTRNLNACNPGTFSERCYQDAINTVNFFPAVDVVPLVRCKDCKYWEQYNACDGTKPYRCMNYDGFFYKRTASDDFCSYGERREGE